jgi:hypothetical protein
MECASLYQKEDNKRKIKSREIINSQGPQHVSFLLQETCDCSEFSNFTSLYLYDQPTLSKIFEQCKTLFRYS